MRFRYYQKRERKTAKILDLHVQEYVALRSEQRTRLDSANKIIHYYAILLGAIVAGSLTLYRYDRTQFFGIFQYILLLIPFISIPFAFAQQSEEVIVRNIGKYIEEHLKPKINNTLIGVNCSFWGWESVHIKNMFDDTAQLLSSAFRALLLVGFSFFSFITFAFLYWNQTCLYFWRCIDVDPIASALMWLDLALIFLGVRINISMLKERKSQVNNVDSNRSSLFLYSFFGKIWSLLKWATFWNDIKGEYKKNYDRSKS